MTGKAKGSASNGAPGRDFVDAIARHWGELTATQRRFIRYAADNQEEVAVSSAGKLGERLGVSASTIVRSAIVLGYAGFPHLQRDLQQQLFSRTSLASRFDATKHEPSNSPRAVLENTFSAEMAALEATLDAISLPSFKESIRRISRARRIYTFGLGISYAPAHVLTVGLRQIGLDARIATGYGTDLAQELHGADSGDVIVVISAARYSARAVDALAFAERRKVVRLAITDSATSPLAVHSDVVLHVRRGPRYFTSITAAVTVVNALVTAVALQGAPQARQSLALLEQEWRDSEAFYEPTPGHHDWDGYGELFGTT